VLNFAPTWPFDVRRVPFFYGWAMLLLTTVGMWVTIPGQTMGMAVFTDYFIPEFGLSRTELSVAYLLGTVGSSLTLTYAGRLYDRHGARTMMVISSVSLGVFVVYISFIGPLGRWLEAHFSIALPWITFPLIALGFFGVRLSGQGVLSSAIRNVLLVWFERRRGLVSGARGVFMSLGFSVAPLVLALLIDAFGWRDALWVLAGVSGIAFALVSLLFARDTPESCGLVPDGVASEQSGGPARSTLARPVNATLGEARRSPVFWIYTIALGMYSLTGTAVTFHVVAIFEEMGRGRTEAFGYFLPLASIAVVVNLLASWWSDRTSLKPYLIAMMGSFLVGSWGLIHLQDSWGLWLMTVGYGMGSGFWAVLSSLAFVRHFGRVHLGEISGFSVSFTVFGSAVGPALFSIGNDLFGSYSAPAWLCGAVFAVVGIAAIWIKDATP
jgi:MFS transporter, OFA family, oxalate/formate antiporter